MTDVRALYSTVPTTKEELALCLADPMWRLCSGQLYKIMVKTPEGDNSVVPFKPNRAQRRFIGRLWHRNIILKARQLGFTTLIAIMWLDHALFNADQRCGIIAQDRDAAKVIFRDKVKFAYDRLPDEIRAKFPTAASNADELLFDHNNSSVRVATSMRSGTIHRLHISEFGKIGAKYPDKAKEVVTGSIPAVPLEGIVVVESTAEGQDGEFYKMTGRAQELHEQGKILTPRDYRFHFFPWWREPGYAMNPAGVVITADDREYFDQVEAETGTTLTLPQRAWYVATRDADFSGDPEKMWQEYPSTALEAFKVSTEGTYYAKQLAAARKQKRIGRVPYIDGLPVNTFWDIGNSDGTAIWLHQRLGAEDRFFKFIEGWGEAYSHYIAELQKVQPGMVWGVHYLPHDAQHKRQGAERSESPQEMLEKFRLGGRWDIVPRVDDINVGIAQTRAKFSTCWFDEEGCKPGLIHLGAYRKKWNEALGAWMQEPLHSIHSEAADAFRQFGQGYVAPRLASRDKPKAARNWRVA